MPCQSCTRDELCIACRFEGREQRLPRYAGRRGATMYHNRKAEPDAEEDSPSWKGAQDETPPTHRTDIQTADHDFKARR